MKNVGLTCQWRKGNTVTLRMTAPESEPISPFPVVRFTVDEYRRLGQVGLLTEDDRVELLEGWVVPKMNLSPAHSVTVQVANDVIRARLPRGWCVRIQDAITTADSEPEPDLAVVRGSQRDYLNCHPESKDTALLIEVADSSLARDRHKCRVYGKARVPAYWIVDLLDQRVEVYTDPTGPDASPGYRRRDDYGLDDHVPLVVDGQTVDRLAVRELLP